MGYLLLATNNQAKVCGYRSLLQNLPVELLTLVEEGIMPVSPFIANLPLGQDTGAFSTDAASGSTSLATNIIESLELGPRCYS